MEVFHFALNPGGYLFLGSSESVDGAGDLFVTVDKEAHIYQGRAVDPACDDSPARRVARRARRPTAARSGAHARTEGA